MKVLVGLSGGVDSAIAAWLLKEQGHDVTCCFMRNWDSFLNNDIAGNPDLYNSVCPQEQDYHDAQAVAESLGLPLRRVDFVREYWNDVFSTFLKEYERGRTPNPDILCNQFIKFDAFFHYAMKEGFDAIATGHYCSNETVDGFTWLTRAADTNKDQTYFLAQIDEKPLSKTIFPLGKLTKPEVRALAERLSLDSVSHKKDSTGICFIGERNFRQFLSNYLPAKEGEMIDIDTGMHLGTHQGVLYYTIGQRKGLNITAHVGPWFVAAKDVQTNTLYLARTDQMHWLDSNACRIEHVNWLVPEGYEFPKECTVKFRYRQKDIPVHLRVEGDTAYLTYPQKCQAVTPGQEAVFYNGEFCLGGGVIEQVFLDDRDVFETIENQANTSHAKWLEQEKVRKAKRIAKEQEKERKKRRKEREAQKKASEADQKAGTHCGESEVPADLSEEPGHGA